MSIIRKRQRKLIGIGFIGFCIGAILMVLLGTWVIRYQKDFVDGLQQGVNHKPKEEVIEKTSVYTVVESVQKGEIVTKEMLMRMEIEPRYVPINRVEDRATIMGRRAKMDLEPKMLLTTSMVESDRTPYLEEGMERVEISALHTPKLLQVGDHVNIRIQFPTGQDYRVIADKVLVDVDTEMEIFYVDLNEDEILNFSSGLVDETIYPGTRLYVTKYLPPDGEDKAESIYPMNPNVEEMGIVKSKSYAAEERMILDASLMEYYDDDTIIYRYNQLELGEQELAGRVQTYMEQREERRALAKKAKDEDASADSKDAAMESEESGSQNQNQAGTQTQTQAQTQTQTQTSGEDAQGSLEESANASTEDTQSENANADGNTNNANDANIEF